MIRRRKSAWLYLPMVVCVFLSGITVQHAAAQATPVPVTGEQYTPVIQSVPSPPRWFTGADEQIHLAYELILTNRVPVNVSVSEVEVLDAETGRTVATLDGDALQAAMSLLTTPTTPTTELPPSTVGVIWFGVALAAEEEIPAAIAQFERTGEIPPLAEVERYYEAQEPIPISPRETGPRRDALPLSGDVVTFPEEGEVS